jgi:hypothetical protein
MVGTLAVTNYRWRSRTAELIDRLESLSLTAPAGVFSPDELDNLPTPVARYFRTVLKEEQPFIRRAWLSQAGDFLLKPGKNGWRPFTAVQHISSRPIGFLWDARIEMVPGLSVRVRDAFVDGTGYMQASLMGLVRLASVQGTPEIAAGALHRYLAETVWCPTALLPSQGVVWTPLDDTRARATLTANGTMVSLDFHFGEDGLVQSVFTPVRAQDVGGHAVPTPWQGRFFDYEERSGMHIPVRGEVEWLLPEGPQVYWRGHIRDVAYG